MKRRVRQLLNERRSMPMMWGMFRPKVLVPAVAQTWSAERIEAVLMHELAHVRRCDCLTQLVSRAVCSLYWYHPLAWWAASRMRVEGEAACDNLVLLTGCRPAVPKDFVICLDFNPGPTKGVFVSHDKEGKSLVGKPKKKAGAFTGGDWMVRVSLDRLKDQPASGEPKAVETEK